MSHAIIDSKTLECRVASILRGTTEFENLYTAQTAVPELLNTVMRLKEPSCFVNGVWVRQGSGTIWHTGGTTLFDTLWQGSRVDCSGWLSPVKLDFAVSLYLAYQ